MAKTALAEKTAANGKYGMKTMAKKDGVSLISSASVVDGKLILSLPDAATPVVWQMDLEQARSSALEVREDAKTGRFTLTVKTPKGESVDIAAYDEKSGAVQALMVTSKALANAHGKIRPVAANTQEGAYGANHFAPQGAGTQANSSRASTILAVLLILILISAWAYSIPKANDSIARTRSASTAATGADTGVAVSADDFLSKRQ